MSDLEAELEEMEDVPTNLGLSREKKKHVARGGRIPSMVDVYGHGQFVAVLTSGGDAQGIDLVLFESAVVNFVSLGSILHESSCLSLFIMARMQHLSETVLFRTESSHALSQTVANVLHKLARDFNLTASCCV